MPQIRYYAPTGVDSVSLTDGPTLYVRDGYVTADSKFALELLKAGFTPGTEDVPIISRNAGGSVSLVGPGGYPIEWRKEKYSNTSFNGTVGNGVNVLLDTCVIPAGTVGPNGSLELTVMYAFTGNNGKDPLVRLGFGSNTWAAGSINWINNQGFTTQKQFRALPLLFNTGAVDANIISPPQSPNYGQSGTNAHVATTIDFSQDVSIYLGGTMLNAFADPADKVKLLWYRAVVRNQ